MSLHAQLSEEAILLLRRQEKKSRILSAVIACLVILLIAGILALFAIPMMLQDTPSIVTYAAEIKEDQDLQEKKVVQQSQRKPSAPAQNIAKVIAASTSAPTAIPVPDIVVTEPSMHFGDDIDFGQGWADDVAIGASGGSFGSTSSDSGGLEGFLYDLKQDARSNPRPYNTGFGRNQDFVNPMLELQRSNFSTAKLRDYFVSPIPLYLTRLAIPLTDANEGPKLFQADKFMEPKGWFALYRGKVVVPRDGEYRFSGASDDYLVVYVDGKMRLNASYPHIRGALSADWKTPEQPGQHNAPFDARRCRIIYGDWIQLRAGQIIDLDIAIGENPGGKLWFLLQIEEKGVEYRKTKEGRPILPLLTTQMILPDDIEEIKKDFPNYEIEFDMRKVPLFKRHN